jgi:hypothetical protein
MTRSATWTLDMHTHTMSGLSWQMQDHPDQVERSIAHLDREQTLHAWEAVEALQRRLGVHYRALGEEPLPVGVVGYPIAGGTR